MPLNLTGFRACCRRRSPTINYMVISMTNPPALSSLAPVPEQSKLPLNKEALESLAAVAVLVGAAYVALTRWTEEVKRKAQTAYMGSPHDLSRTAR